MDHNEKGFLDIVYDFFRSLKLTIFLLILLAMVSIIGTVIKQNALAEEYIERYGLSLYNVLDFFNLFDMYHSWWFSAILLLLVINLVACSVQRFPGAWRQIFRESGAKELGDSMLRILPYVERINLSNARGVKENDVRSLIKGFKKVERIDGESFITLYSEKGRFSRLGVYITHLSILIILIGGILGSLFGFRGYVNILEGETVDHIALRTRDEEVIKPIGFSVRCDDFRINFYDLKSPEKHVKDYMSDLTVIENGKEVLKKTIVVNRPLHYKGLTFYQSSYGAIHDLTLGVQWRNNKKQSVLLRVSEGATVPIPNSQALLKVLKYSHEVHNFGEGVQVALFKPNQEPRAFWLLKGFPNFDEQRNDEFIFRVEEVIERQYTGLQVTKDPGVWIVWIGCSLMIIGLIISFFFSHQRIWVRIPSKAGGEIVLAGSTNKNRVGFEKRFNSIAEEVRCLVKP